MERKNYLIGCLALLLTLLWLPGKAQNNINYSLPKTGKVSVVIYDANGKLVRTLLNAQQRNSGNNTEIWDGKDDNGNSVGSPSTCTWKLLHTQGLQANYVGKLGTTFPQGKEWGETGLGNHSGPRSVAADASGIYVGSGIAENVRNGIKNDLGR